MREAANAAVLNVSVSVGEPPLFRHMDGALWFAFNFKHGTIKPSALAGMMAGKWTKGRGLGGLDGAAQAGMIKSEVAALGWKEVAKAWGWTDVDDVLRQTDYAGEARAAILVARFSPMSVHCGCESPCCQGFRPNAEWTQAVDVLCAHTKAASIGSTCNSKLRRGLVARFFGLRASFLRLSDECGVNRDTASVHNSVVDAWLSGEERLARYEIEGRLKMAGIIE